MTHFLSPQAFISSLQGIYKMPVSAVLRLFAVCILKLLKEKSATNKHEKDTK